MLKIESAVFAAKLRTVLITAKEIAALPAR